MRVRRAYALDLLAAWPRLWLLLPDPPRAEITAVQDGHAAAARLGGWALLYLLLGAVWWPALIAAMVLGLTSWYRARSTADVLAALIEAGLLAVSSITASREVTVSPRTGMAQVFVQGALNVRTRSASIRACGFWRHVRHGRQAVLRLRADSR
ncbi:hypothetical protein ACIBHY_31315 [Nonomuraea sp. NPDC050547]|uniref:hypothetical protein n=1 Tax=Nonomuraea sp. NPDC050547 TaxID=3364368 RepID=UPI0037BD7230